MNHTNLIKEAVIRKLEKRANPVGRLLGKLFMTTATKGAKSTLKPGVVQFGLGMGASLGLPMLLGQMGGGGSSGSTNVQNFNTIPGAAGMTQTQYANVMSPPPYVPGGYSPFHDPSSSLFKG